MDARKQRSLDIKYDEPRFATKTDSNKRLYFTGYSNSDGKAVVSFKGSNLIVSGNPKITCRVGDSMFGDEIVFELLIKGKSEIVKQRSEYDTVEIYLPLQGGLKFLEDAVAYFKTKLSSVDKPVNTLKS